MQKSIPFPASRNIMAIYYDDESQTMTVMFQKGGVVEYYDVPEDVAMGFERALGATAYLNAFIVGSYPEMRMG